MVSKLNNEKVRGLHPVSSLPGAVMIWGLNKNGEVVRTQGCRFCCFEQRIMIFIDLMSLLLVYSNCSWNFETFYEGKWKEKSSVNILHSIHGWRVFFC